METCVEYNQIMIDDFKSYARSQGDNEIHFDSFCFEAQSYPIEGFNKIELVPNKDILLQISKKKSTSQILIGFALESDNEINNAISKLKNKNLDFVVLNSTNDEDAGFSVDTNKITIIDSENNIEEFKLKSKYNVSKDIFNKILKIKK